MSAASTNQFEIAKPQKQPGTINTVALEQTYKYYILHSLKETNLQKCSYSVAIDHSNLQSSL